MPAALGQDLPLIERLNGTLQVCAYRPLAFHARGGLGEVFRAEDEELHRVVALKRIQTRHQDNPDSRRRFLVEAEITGQLEHPGIVPVYGLVDDADGKLCYAMRFVKGQTLDEALQFFHQADKNARRNPGERGLAMRELLNRFIAVCNTVAYAHNRGILHRDLKPANIILGKFGETLVIDWGLAKAFALSEGQAYEVEEPIVSLQSIAPANATHVGRSMGTPGYMSPEQAQGHWHVVGPASDVFSLGATLYAILAGQAPYQGRDKETVLDQARRGDCLPLRQVCPKVPRDLEMICRKSMHKDPSRRYPTAKALADDLERWMADEPVKAYREPLLQRGRRWLRKHRTLVGSSVAALLVTAICLAGATVLLGEAYEQERVAKEQKDEQLLAATAAEEAARKAEAKAKSAQKQSDKVTEFLVEAFRGADPRMQGLDLKVVDVLDAAVAKLQREAEDDPLIKARLLAAIGETYLSLKDGKKAVVVFELERQLRMSLGGLNDDDTLISMDRLASAYRTAGRLNDAVVLFEKTLMLRKANFGEEHPHTAQTKHNLATAYRAAGRPKDAVLLFEDALIINTAKLGAEHPLTLEGKNSLARTYEDLGRMSDALPMLEETLKVRREKFGDSAPETLTSMNNLAAAYKAANRLNEALPLFEETLRLRTTKLGPTHPDTLESMNNLAATYQAAGRLNEALPLFEDAFRLYKSKVGPDHPSTLTSMNNLAMGYRAAGRPKEAIPLGEEAVELAKANLGLDHPTTMSSMDCLAEVYISAGRAREGLLLLEKTLVLRQANLGTDHRVTLRTMNDLGVAYQSAGRLGDALSVLESACKLSEGNPGVDHGQRINVMANLAAAYYAVGRINDCAKLLEGTLALRKSKLGADHLDTVRNLNDLGNVYTQEDRLQDALPLFEDALKLSKAARGAEDHDTLESMHFTAITYLALGRHKDAEPLLRECLAIRERKEPQLWTTFMTQLKLGACLLEQGQDADAEPLLLKAHANMKKQVIKMSGRTRQRFTEAAALLVQIYTAAGQADNAEKWRRELEIAKKLEKDAKK